MRQTFDESTDPSFGPKHVPLIRKAMAEQGLDGFVTPHEDEHQYEYLPAALSVDSTFLGTSLALFKRGRSLMEVLIAEKVRFHRTSLLVTTLIGSLTLLAVAIQLYIARDGLFRDASLFKIGLTVSTLSAAIGSVSSAVRAFFGDQSAIADVREFLEFLDFPDTEKGRKDASFVMDPRDSVRVADAKFAYPYVTNAPLVLNGVSLEFVPGEAVALVGANGSGKTTLSCLLTNTHRPKEGCVMHGATPIGDYTARSVLEHTLVVPQSGDLPDIPLCESLFGVTDMVYIDKERYLRAIAMSGAREVLDRLPNGIHTLIGTQFTGGTNLSGGEEQRLRLAGFLYRTLDPLIRFVIADEPSRHLDPATRRRVYDELIALARNSGKIVIVISHDADLLKFDRVVLLDDGRVYGDYRGEAISEAVNLVSQRLVDDAVRD